MTNQFKDIDLSFNAHPVTGDVSIRTGTRAVMQSLREIVITSQRGWEFDRTLGAGIYDKLGENLSPLDTIEIKDSIEEQINIHEPRVELEEVRVGMSSSEPNTLRIQIVFYVVNQPDPQTLDIPLVRLR